MATFAAKQGIEQCFHSPTCKKQIIDSIITTAALAEVTLTASEIDLNTINKYLEYTNFLDLWDLVKPSYIGKKVTINPVDVLVRRGLSVEDAEAFLNSLTLNERQLISLAYADPMENEFLEENVLRVYNLDYDNYLNKKQGHQNNNDLSEGARLLRQVGLQDYCLIMRMIKINLRLVLKHQKMILNFKIKLINRGIRVVLIHPKVH